MGRDDPLKLTEQVKVQKKLKVRRFGFFPIKIGEILMLLETGLRQSRDRKNAVAHRKSLNDCFI